MVERTKRVGSALRIRNHVDDSSHRIKSNDFNVGFFYLAGYWLFFFVSFFFRMQRDMKRRGIACRRYLKSINYEGR